MIGSWRWVCIGRRSCLWRGTLRPVGPSTPSPLLRNLTYPSTSCTAFSKHTTNSFVNIESHDLRHGPANNSNHEKFHTFHTKIASFRLFSFIQATSITPRIQVHNYSEALPTVPTQHGYCVGVSRRSATGNWEWRTCQRSLRGGQSGIRTHDPSDERRWIYQWATTLRATCLELKVSLTPI